MSKTKIRFYLWLSVLILSGVILSLASFGLLAAPFKELLIVIDGTVIASLVLTEIDKRLKQPIILITPDSKMFDIGFNVEVKDKNIQNATVLCDDTRFNWVDRDGKETESQNLLVGNIPACFYPFKAKILSKQITDKEQILNLSITQKMAEYGDNFKETFERTVYSGDFPLPRGSFGAIKFKSDFAIIVPEISCKVRLIGEGIEEKINRQMTFEIYPIFMRTTESDKVEAITLFYDFAKPKKKN